MSEILLSSNYFLNPYAIPYFLVSIFLFALAIFVYLQNRKSITHISYLIGCLSGVLWLLGDFLVISTQKNISAIFWSKFVYIGITLIPPGMYFFSCAWLNVIRKKKKWILFNYLLGIIFIVLFFTTDKFVIGYQRYFFGNYSRLGRLGFIYLIYFFSISFTFFKNIIEDYFKEPEGFRKIHKKRIIIAFVFVFAGSLDFLPTYGISIYPIGFLSVLLFNIIVAHTIIRYRLMDIETVIHKTIAWLISNAFLILPFVALIYLTKTWYLNLKPWAALSLLGLITLLFLLLLRLLQPKIDHFFQRRRFNLDEISSRFIDDLVHLKGLGPLISHIEATIAHTLYPQHIGIYIYNEREDKYKLADTRYKPEGVMEPKNDDEFLLWLTRNGKITYKEFIDTDPAYTLVKEKAKDYFNATESIVVIPLVLNDRLLGIINLDKKANLKHYTALDFHFLTTLKNQSSIAISNSLLYDNIEEQVRQRTKELMEVQKQLVQAEKLATVGTLAGGVAHEINNPLTAILTNVQMLLVSGSEVDAKLDRESLQLIEEATKRCRTIVQKLMAYAKKPLEAANVTELDLSKVINNVVSFLGYQLEQENIKININAKKKDSCLVIGNHNELEQVLINIILNARDAIKRMKKGGIIDILVSQDNGWIKIQIKDEGIGIPKEIMPKIFDPFFTTKDVGKGLGLGLSICQTIMEKHGGSITVQSEVNKGSVFTLRIPAVKAKERIKLGAE
jgi:signal transduction histidine kinase